MIKKSKHIRERFAWCEPFLKCTFPKEIISVMTQEMLLYFGDVRRANAHDQFLQFDPNKQILES